MSKFQVPTREQVSTKNQEIFDNLQKGLGFVPNLYAAMGKSENALGNFLSFSGGATSFSKKEKEVIDLAVSQVNGCSYCQAAHTALAKMNGFTEEQTLELRQGRASWDGKYNALASIAKEIAEQKGNVSDAAKAAFYSEGYTDEHLVDLVLAVGSITITNFFHNLTDVAVDFPAAPSLN